MGVLALPRLIGGEEIDCGEDRGVDGGAMKKRTWLFFGDCFVFSTFFGVFIRDVGILGVSDERKREEIWKRGEEEKQER